MSEFTRPATWADVKRVAALLDQAGADYALVGGYALAAHGYSRFTEDVDVLVNPSPQNAIRWTSALAQLPDGAARELSDETDPFARNRLYAIRINDEFTVDIPPTVAGHDWDEMARYIETVEIDGTRIRILNLHGLLLSKESDRPKDRMDAAVLPQAIEALKKNSRT